MKGLFIAFEFEYNANLFDGDKKCIDGVEKKIFYQYTSFEKNGIEMTFYNPYKGKKHSVERILRRFPFHYLTKWQYNIDEIVSNDFIYIRKMWFMDGDLIRFLQKIKEIKPNMIILLEVPTYPYDNEGNKLDMIPLKMKDKKWRKRLYKYVDRIVTYSDDDFIFKIPTIKSSNAIDFATVKRKENHCDGNQINMIACANLYYWHGFDRAIEGLYRYYEKKPNGKINLYIVGDGEEKAVYEEMVNQYKLNNHVFVVGGQYGEKLDELYSRCTVGLDSMGRHRSGVSYNSSLKGKEYCAKGLIIISGVKTELDSYDNYSYYYRVPASDEMIDFEKFEQYYNNLLKVEDVLLIQNNIMSFAKQHFDYSIAMKPIIDFLNNRL